MKLLRLDEMMERSGVRFGTSGARGLVAEMSDEVCYAYASAFLQTDDAATVVLGHDLRPSSPRIAAACAAAVEDSGRRLIYAGALPTPALAYYAAQLGASAIVVTGSHIPFDRNGIKFYRADGEITKADEQSMREAMVDVAAARAVTLPAPDERAQTAYVKRYLDFFGVGALDGMRVAIFEHSSVGRDVLRGILEGLGAQVISLGRTDVFVPIDTEAVRAEDIVQAELWAREHRFDAILSTDGDADRPLIGDENGHWFRGDVVGILCAQYLHAEVVVTPVSSNSAVEKCGLFTHVMRTMIGSPYVIEGMQACAGRGVVVGYEANGGFLLGSDLMENGRRMASLPTRDAVLPMLALLCMARERKYKVSDLAQALPERYTASDRLQNFPSQKSRSLILSLLESNDLLSAMLAPQAGVLAKIDQTDGLRVTFASGDIVHLRSSGNAPELRCYSEANNPERAKSLCDECLERVSRCQ